jgi:hypothetical protein
LLSAPPGNEPPYVGEMLSSLVWMSFGTTPLVFSMAISAPVLALF